MINELVKQYPGYFWFAAFLAPFLIAALKRARNWWSQNRSGRLAGRAARLVLRAQFVAQTTDRDFAFTCAKLAIWVSIFASAAVSIVVFNLAFIVDIDHSFIIHMIKVLGDAIIGAEIEEWISPLEFSLGGALAGGVAGFASLQALVNYRAARFTVSPNQTIAKIDEQLKVLLKHIDPDSEEGKLTQSRIAEAQAIVEKRKGVKT